MAYDAKQLLTLTQTQLDALFTDSPVGDIPVGEGAGMVIIAPGTVFSPEIANFVNLFAWQGKIFDPATGTLRNKILPFGLNAVIAKVYKGPSWLDGKECTILDYSETSLVAHWLRDELRLVGPALYLGKVYLGRERLIDFSLQF